MGLVNHMEVICFEDAAYFSMIEAVVKRLKDKNDIKEEKWIATHQAIALLNITSKTMLQDLRDQDDICFSQPKKKVIHYDRESILEYLEKHSRNTF